MTGLDDWSSPLKRIAKHISKDKNEYTSILKYGTLYKKLFDATGICVSAVDEIVELCENGSPRMLSAARALGFRGKYLSIDPSDTDKIPENELELCIYNQKFITLKHKVNSKNFIKYG